MPNDVLSPPLTTIPEQSVISDTDDVDNIEHEAEQEAEQDKDGDILMLALRDIDRDVSERNIVSGSRKRKITYNDD